MRNFYDQTGKLVGFEKNGCFYDQYGNYLGIYKNGCFYDQYGNITRYCREGNVYDQYGNLLVSDGDGYVYVIQDIDTCLYKIGITNNPDRRLKELGVGNTAVLISCEYYENAREIEKNAHKRYGKYRLPQTEYFKLNQPPAIY